MRTTFRVIFIAMLVQLLLLASACSKVDDGGLELHGPAIGFGRFYGGAGVRAPN